MRKLDLNSFRITGNTNFKKKLTNLSGEIQLWKSKLQLKFADTQPALKLLSLNDCYEWTLRNKIIQTEVIFWKIYLKSQMILYSHEIHLFQRNVPVYTQLKFLINAMKTSQQSCLEFEGVP